jgi:hypothetical protein
VSGTAVTAVTYGRQLTRPSNPVTVHFEAVVKSTV